MFNERVTNSWLGSNSETGIDSSYPYNLRDPCYIHEREKNYLNVTQC